MTDERLLHEALATINRLQKKLEQRDKLGISNAQKKTEVAIVGMSCQFPMASDLIQFWHQLENGFDAISHYPESRLSLLGLENQLSTAEAGKIYGGYLEDISLFDPAAFGISPREANCMDPQQRLLLLNVHQAIHDAGIMEHSDFAKTGIFVAQYASEYMRYAPDYNRENALLIATGNVGSISANRISYHYGLSGPSMVLDTACSSGLAAVDIALHYLRSGSINYAIVAGVSLNLDPFSTRLLQDANMLSPDGRCKTFDAAANGYVPGEGVGVLVLQRLSDAASLNSRVYSVIIGSAINQDGKSNGLTAPNGVAQEQVINRAFEQAGLTPDAAQYIETHGTGTFLGDPVEIEALSNVIGKAPDEAPCVLGCLKTNIGHLEPAAGIASLIKASLCLHKARIPANNHLHKVNPLLKLDSDRFLLPQAAVSWQQAERVAGVSSFGFGGLNGHVVLKNPAHELAARHADLLETYSIAELDLKHYWYRKKNSGEKIRQSFLEYSCEKSGWDTLNAIFRVSGSTPGARETGNFHVGFYIESLYKLFMDQYKADSLYIDSIRFFMPVLISANTETLIRASVTKSGKKYGITFCYRYQNQEADWQKSAEAQVQLSIPPSVSESPCPSDASSDSSENLDRDQFYRRYTEMGFPADGFIRSVKQSKIGESTTETVVSVSSDKSTYRLGAHPGFLDVALQPGLVLMSKLSKVPYMTSLMEAICIYRPLHDSEAILCSRVSDIVDRGAGFCQSWQLKDAEGNILISCRQAQLRRLSHNPVDHGIQNVPEELSPATILQCIADQLECEVEDIKQEARLLELGMDSLMIMQLQKILESHELPINNLFSMTVEALLDEVAHFYSNSTATTGDQGHDHSVTDSDFGPILHLVPHEMHATRWLLGEREADAKFRLYCLPYGYLSASMFRHWQDLLPDWIDVCPIELPGRGERLNERPIQSVLELAKCMTDVFKEELEIPFAVFGHSAGAFIGYVWSLYLQNNASPHLPRHLFAAAYTAPGISENPVLAKVKEAGLAMGLPHLPSLDSITTDCSKSYIEKVIAVHENLNHQAGNTFATRDMIHSQLHSAVAQLYMIESFDSTLIMPLSAPISALYGDRDPLVSLEDMVLWKNLTSSKYDLKRFPGNHLFMEEDQNETELLDYIGQVLLTYSDDQGKPMGGRNYEERKL